jgi:hypothetical protein
VINRLPLEQQILLAIQTAALIGLCVHMWRARLQRTFVYFFGYLLIVLIQTVILGAFIPYDGPAYVYVWLGTEGLIVCFYAFIVLELYGIVLGDLPGLVSVSRRYLRIALALAIVISGLLLTVDKSPASIIGGFLVFERTVVCSLLLFVLFLSIFLVYYPVPLNRNVIVYSMGYAVYFLTKVAALWARNVGNRWSRSIDTLLIAASTSCLIFWLFALNQQGQAKTAVIGHKWRSGDEERLLSQLKEINASMSRLGRKRF